jgi:hypothetical protein
VIILLWDARGGRIVYAESPINGVLRNFFAGWCYVLSLLDGKVRNFSARIFTEIGPEDGIPRKHALPLSGIERAGIGDPGPRARRVPFPVSY